MRASFLLPDGWSVARRSGDGTQALFLTQTPIVDGKPFSVGLTVNAIHHVERKKGVPPSELARTFRDRAAAKSPLLDRQDGSYDTFQTVAYTVQDPRPPAVTLRTVFIANDTTGTLYWLIFETPSDRWEATAPIREKMLGQLMLDDAS